MRLLVIEPDRFTAEALMEFLSANGDTANWVQGAEQAITAIDKALPDVIITELALGAHSGIEFLHEFKSYAEWSHIPVIVFTMEHLQDPSKLLQLGASAYLYKPKTTLQQLQHKIKALTNK